MPLGLKMATCSENINYVVDLTPMFLQHGDVFCSLFTDGRPASFLSEKLCVAIFHNIFYRTAPNSSFDLVGEIDGKFSKIEVKTLTKNGLKLVQSKSIGVGRTINDNETKNWKDCIDYFMIVDCSKMDKLAFSLITANSVEARAYTNGEAIRKFFNFEKVEI